MRTNNKLYRILTEQIKDRNCHNEGLCNNINRIYMNDTITIQECESLEQGKIGNGHHLAQRLTKLITDKLNSSQNK